MTPKTTDRLRELPSVCAWCRRVRDPLDNRWVTTDPSRAGSDGGNSYGICPDCHSAVAREALRCAAGGRGA
jgi:hypothetical protein